MENKSKMVFILALPNGKTRTPTANNNNLEDTIDFSHDYEDIIDLCITKRDLPAISLQASTF